MMQLRAGGVSRAAATWAAGLLIVLGSASGAWAIDPPAPPVLFPDDPGLQQAYEDGFTTGYSVGNDDGFADGRREAGDQADLRDDVANEAEQEPVEGGRDLGDELPTPSPTPSATPTPESVDPGVDQTSTYVEDPPQQSGGVPWWPLAFAVAATAWFVTRRRRPDGEDSAAPD